MQKSALIIIDLQKAIFKLKKPVFESERLIKNIKELILKAEKKEMMIIFTQHENKSFLQKGSVGWEIIDELKPKPENTLIQKKHPSIFKNTSLLDVLKKENIPELYISGLVSNGCVKQACSDALSNNLEVFLISDAHSTFFNNAKKIISEINNELKAAGVKLTSVIDF